MTRKRPSRRITQDMRERYAVLEEPTYEFHSELGLKPWHDQLRPGHSTLEEAIAEARQVWDEPNAPR